MRYKTPLPLAALAAAALALPASAAAESQPNPPYALIPVPAGEVQHTVIETTFQSNVTVPGVTPWQRVQEIWAGAGASRTVLSNGENGQLLSECTSTVSSFYCFEADDNGLVRSGTGGPQVAAGRSWETEAGIVKQEIARGGFQPTGNTTLLGRPAEIYTSPGSSEGRLTLVVDDATGYPLQQSVSFTNGTQTGSQVSTVKVFETMSPAAAAEDLAPRAHPGATASRTKRHHKRRPKHHGKPNAK